MDKNTYKLLTPGPLTTTETVKEAMQIDRCTWDEDYKSMTQEIRTGLLKLAHADNGDYTTVLMQGSGTFGVESVLSSVISSTDKVLVLQTAHTANAWWKCAITTALSTWFTKKIMRMCPTRPLWRTF